MLAVAGVGAAAGLFFYIKHNLPTAFALENNLIQKETKEPGSFVDGLPVYTSDDVAKHTDESTGIWISYKSGVYDITPFVKRHPGIKNYSSHYIFD